VEIYRRRGTHLSECVEISDEARRQTVRCSSADLLAGYQETQLRWGIILVVIILSG
jgi:hypothetical protein